MAIRVRPATIGDAAALSRLGATTFRQTFDGTTSAEKMNAYLREAYYPEKQRSEIEDPDNTVLVSESDNGELVGFAYVGTGEVIEGLSGPGVGVWEHNVRALGFYRKYGFEHVGEHPFVLGDDAQTDWVLARSLAKPDQ